MNIFSIVCLLRYEGIGLVLPIENSLSARARPRFDAIVRIATAVLMVCFGAVGVACGVAYRDDARLGGSITAFLEEYTRGRGAVGVHYFYAAINATMTAAVTITFPLQLFPAVEVSPSNCTCLRPVTLSGHIQ